MKISIFGLGYVGAVTAACLAKNGHTVIGVDSDTTKVDLMSEGKTPIIEKDLEALIALNVKANRLSVTTQAFEAIQNTEASLVCVGTPSKQNGSLDLSAIERVASEIGIALAGKNSFHLVIVRSTMLPGTVEGIIIPILEKKSGKKCGKAFGVSYNPEFLRESTAVFDFFNPPKTIIGARHADHRELTARLYRGIDAPLIYSSIKVAEMVKYVDNSFHALKITFANEIGLICKKLGIDSHEVMNIFCQDTKLNLSPSYLKPGFAFGGSCLPKDLRAISYLARHIDLNLPVLDAILPSNKAHIEYTMQLVRQHQKRKIGILGLAFKSGTDDLRESPAVVLTETLIGQGHQIRIYDKNVSLSWLRGANRNYINEKIPHIGTLIREDMEEVISFADLIIIGNNSEEFVNIFSFDLKGKAIIDLVRISEEFQTLAEYEGICW